jgi:hypothetical protein
MQQQQRWPGTSLDEIDGGTAGGDAFLLKAVKHSVLLVNIMDKTQRRECK